MWVNNALENRCDSWDQIAVLYSTGTEYFNIENGSLMRNKFLETFWNPKIINERYFKITVNTEDYKMEKIT